MKKNEKQRIRKLSYSDLLNETNKWHRIVISREAQARNFSGDPLIPMNVNRQAYSKERYANIRQAKKTLAFLKQELHKRTLKP